MPNCKGCGRSVERLIRGEVCGICDINMAGQAPGLIGQDYRGQINPEVHDAVKEMEIGMRSLELHTDDRQKISNAEAERFKRTLIAPARAKAAFEAKHSEAVDRYKRTNEEMIRVQEKEMVTETANTKKRLVKLVKHASVVGPPRPTR